MIREQCVHPLCTGNSTLRAAQWRLFAGILAVLLLGASASGQKISTEGASRRSPDQLKEDDAAVVAASPDQITAVLRSDPGLFLELKQWIANEVATRGQVILE